jgi:hypothetical protein
MRAMKSSVAGRNVTDEQSAFDETILIVGARRAEQGIGAFVEKQLAGMSNRSLARSSGGSALSLRLQASINVVMNDIIQHSSLLLSLGLLSCYQHSYAPKTFGRSQTSLQSRHAERGDPS